MQSISGSKIAGTKFITLIFVIPSILSDNATIKSEPITDICEIIYSVKIGETTVAKRVKPPSINSTEREANITPTPRLEVSAIAATQSITDFE